MRTALALALALVALAPLASTAGVSVCADPCRIDSRSEGFLPPAMQIATGTSVVWGSQDITHSASDGLAALDPDPCFVAYAAPGNDSEPIRFDIVGDTLVASSTWGELACETARGVGLGGFALPYHCTLHTEMRGLLVVTAA